MKTKPQYLMAAALAVSATLAVAQDAPPAPPTPPNPPSESTPPKPPGRDPGHDGWRGEHHGDRRDGGPRSQDGRDDRDGGPRSNDGRVGRDGGPRSDGDRRGDAMRERGPMRMPPIPTKPTSYVGVVTTPLPAVLTSQLGLADGFGLVVGEVLPDSPAAKAGLQRFDVLTKFNDQQIVDSNQLSTLVRAQKKDAEASLTFIRKAQEQKATVTIGEKALPVRQAFSGPRPIPGGGPVFLHRGFDGGRDQDNAKRMQDRVRSFGDKMREFKERMKDWQKNPSAEIPEPPDAPSFDVEQPLPPEQILREIQPGGVAQIRLLQGEGNVTYNTASAKVFVKDGDGEIEITGNDGKRSLVARNAQGETVFEGPIDTEEQRKALPEEIRKKVDLIEIKMAQARGEAFASSTAEPEVQ